MPESKLSKAFNSILNHIKGKRAVTPKTSETFFSQLNAISEQSAKDAEMRATFQNEKLVVKN